MCILKVKNLSVLINDQNKKPLKIIDKINFCIQENEFVCLLGESGCGKSVLMHAITGLSELKPGIIEGEIIIENKNLLDGSISKINERSKFRFGQSKFLKSEIEKIRKEKLGLVFQEHATSINPFIKLEQQINESINNNSSGFSLNELLKMTGLNSSYLKEYSLSLSGGLSQKVMILMGIASKPKLLIADEPTSSLDTKSQKEVLDLLKNLSQSLNIAVLLVTHDLNIAIKYSDQILVMYGGEIVESINVAIDSKGQKNIDHAVHPFTIELIKCRENNQYWIKGDPPDPAVIITGCKYFNRCDLRSGSSNCEFLKPDIKSIASCHSVMCHLNKVEYVLSKN